MLYEITTSKKGANSIWLAEHFGIQQKTAWLFRHKAQMAMKSSEQYPLEQDVHVDEFEIGTPQKGEQGRSKSKKKMRTLMHAPHMYQLPSIQEIDDGSSAPSAEDIYKVIREVTADVDDRLKKK